MLRGNPYQQGNRHKPELSLLSECPSIGSCFTSVSITPYQYPSLLLCHFYLGIATGKNKYCSSFSCALVDVLPLCPKSSLPFSGKYPARRQYSIVKVRLLGNQYKCKWCHFFLWPLHCAINIYLIMTSLNKRVFIST